MTTTINLDELIPSEAIQTKTYDSQFARNTWNLDHFANFVLVMDSGRGYDTRFSIGGWDHDGFGRKTDGGPVVEGPHAYMFGLPAILSARPEPVPVKIRFEEGSRLQIRNEVYVVEFMARDRRKEFPILKHIASVASRD